MPQSREEAGGKIVTFYSYKGGTGRSMLLANVAWVIANSGKRVLAIDWDLEAPGLHRYFEPFLSDPRLETSTGIIDFVLDYATVAVSEKWPKEGGEWYAQQANLLRHTLSVDWQFADNGLLDLVPAGIQDTAYASRVNSFDWHTFYQKLGGGVLLEAVKAQLRAQYDYILIDSRTGVSDTSGVCSVQMPDEIVVCFTLNRQSIYGSSAVALSSQHQRRGPDGQSRLKVWPVPTRVDHSEKDKLEFMRTLARTKFSPTLRHLSPESEDHHWGNVDVPYSPYYAYEEVLAVFADKSRQTGTLLSKVEFVATTLMGTSDLAPMDESQRLEGLSKFTTRRASAYTEELKLLAQEYESIRERMAPGNPRTTLMTALTSRVRMLAGGADAAQIAETLFSMRTDGARVVGLALAQLSPQRAHVQMALEGIEASRSAFEQYHALVLASLLLNTLDPTAVRRLGEVISEQRGKNITKADPSRWILSERMLKTVAEQTPKRFHRRTGETSVALLLSGEYELVECRPPSSFVRYEDSIESHGSFVQTRGAHSIELPPLFALGRFLVTNELFHRFVVAGGYETNDYWRVPQEVRARMLTADGKTCGPAGWLDTQTFQVGTARHPVSGISLMEAEAFVAWSNASNRDPSWRWTVPWEDIWEYSARAEAGLTYPWGDAFESSHCNSVESGVDGTTDVDRYPNGASPIGCFDMAGNVWEFVVTPDSKSEGWATLRGGSYKNNFSEVRSYLRLTRVPITHRPSDFGFRMARVHVE